VNAGRTIGRAGVWWTVAGDRRYQRILGASHDQV
jgi:hypothetical protein